MSYKSKYCTIVLIITLIVLSCQNAIKKTDNQIITFNLKELPETVLTPYKLDRFIKRV